MFPEPNRTKKLIIAFHFCLSGQTGWRCDECRKNGLEARRACQWQGGPESRRMVWVRSGVYTDRCPRSEVTGESLALLEEFAAWKTLGGANLHDLPARTADAYCLLENEARSEREHGTR